jgi:hypothetical protein
MPIRDTLKRTTEPSEETLRAELLAELRNPKEAGEPDIVLQGTTLEGVSMGLTSDEAENMGLS